MLFVCHMTPQSYLMKGLVVLVEIDNPVKFGGYKHCGSGDIIFLVVEN